MENAGRKKFNGERSKISYQFENTAKKQHHQIINQWKKVYDFRRRQ
jgi:hypothetical protein